MNEAEARRQYNSYEQTYKDVQKKVETEIRAHLGEHFLSVDIDGVAGRTDPVSKQPEIKAFEAVFRKVQDPAKTDIRNIKDISGVRVVCHCKSDRDRAIALLLEFLPGKFRIIESADENTEDGYKAHHIVVSSLELGPEYMCEIQVRTVLQHAWSVQSHKYGYKKAKEGDSNILMQSMSGILDSCEKLWELVKQKNQNGNQTVDEAAEKLSKEVEQQLEANMPIRPAITRETINAKLRSFSEQDQFDLQDMIQREVDHLRSVWETQVAAETPSVSTGEDAFALMQREMLNLTLIGLIAIRYKRSAVLKLVLESFIPISELTMVASSSLMIPWKSIPRGILHNTYYYFCIFALKQKDGDLLKLLIDFKMELKDGARRAPPARIWSRAAFFAPEILNSASDMFDRLRKCHSIDDIIREVIGNLAEDDFLQYACQVNMLFRMRMAQELEIDIENAPFWAYPNYGRFYESRVTPLMDRAEWYEDYKKLLLTIFEMKDFDEFTKKASDWLKWSAGHDKVGSGYMWESVWSWIRPKSLR